MFMDDFKDILQFIPSIKQVQENGIQLPFLSNQIINHKGRLVCVPYDMEKFGASLILPSSFAKLERAKSQRERLAGVYISGGWIDPVLGKFCRDTYRDLTKAYYSKIEFVDPIISGENDLDEILDAMQS